MTRVEGMGSGSRGSLEVGQELMCSVLDMLSRQDLWLILVEMFRMWLNL